MDLARRIDTWISGYPDTVTRRLLHRLPVPLWRLGLGGIVARTFLILSTTGRRSGQSVHTPLMPHRLDGVLYVWCPYGDRGQWYRNVEADPVVTVQDVAGTWSARARHPDDDAELARVHGMLQGFDADLLRRYVQGQGIGGSVQDFVAHKDRLHVLRLDPAPGPSPTPLTPGLRCRAGRRARAERRHGQ